MVLWVGASGVWGQQPDQFLGRSSAQWSRDLASPQARQREAAAYALGKLRTHAAAYVPQLVGLLADPDPEVREAAAWALGQIGQQAAPRAAAELRQRLLEDAAAGVRAAAAFALGCFQDKDAAEALVRALDDPEAVVRQNAVYALGQLGREAVQQHVSAMAAKLRDPHPQVRRDAAVALGQGKQAAAPAVPHLIAALEDEAAPVRRCAATALGKVGPEARSALPSLRRIVLARGQDRELWREALLALCKIAGEDDVDSLPAVRLALKDPDPLVRQEGTRALFRMAEQPEVQDCLSDLADLLSDPEVQVRRNAAACLSRAVRPSGGQAHPRYTSVLQPILQALQKDDDEMVGLFLARACAGFDLADPNNRSARDALIRLALRDRRKIVRYQLACDLGIRLGPDARDVTPTLLELLRDTSVGLVQRTEVQSEVRGGEARGGGTRIREQAGGDARVLAARALGRIGSAAGPTARKALEQVANNPANPPELRAEALEALASFR
jgi:HEAT repeat protein